MSCGFDTILVPLDGSEVSTCALEPAKKAVATGGTIVLFQVVDLVAPHYLPAGTDKEALWKSQAAPAHKSLEREARVLEEAGIKVETQVASGPIAEVIVDYVRQRQADLVVMTTHARTGVRHLLMGSVAEDVVRTSPVPVMVVRPD